MPQKLLVIPDVHQDFKFLDALQEEQDFTAFDRIIFLGDFIDAKRSEHDSEKSLRKTLKRVKRLVEAHGDKIVLIPGNHDLPYFGARPSEQSTGVRNSVMSSYGCGPVMQDIHRALLKHWEPHIWDRFVPMHFENGFIFSHAGFALDWWEELSGPLQSIEMCLAACEAIWEAAGEGRFSPLFGAGTARGGDLPVGGPFWLDFHHEFNDNLPYPQIVGHTSGSFARQSGRSWCLDARQSIYGIVTNEVEVHRIKGR